MQGGGRPSEMVLAQYSPTDVIGNLGGMKVVIPRYFAEYVEYENDSEIEETRKRTQAVRTFDSRLESFGMDVRFPDMQGLVHWRDRQEMHRQSPHESNWLRVSVTSGKYYYGDKSLDRLAFVALKPDLYPGDYWWNNYVKLPENEFGLDIYVVAGIDPHSGKPAQESHHTSDIYLYQQTSGKVDTYIICRRPRALNGVAGCDMKFTLEPTANVGVKVDFRRGLLPEWRKIRESVHDLLLSFEVNDRQH